MSDDKMADDFGVASPDESMPYEESVVQALDAGVWSEADAESKIRAKLSEFAAELQTARSIQDIL